MSEQLLGWQQTLRMVFPLNSALQLIEKHSTSKGCGENTFQTINRGWRSCLIKSVLRLQEGKASLSLPELTRFKLHGSWRTWKCVSRTNINVSERGTSPSSWRARTRMKRPMTALTFQLHSLGRKHTWRWAERLNRCFRLQCQGQTLFFFFFNSTYFCRILWLTSWETSKSILSQNFVSKG